MGNYKPFENSDNRLRDRVLLVASAFIAPPGIAKIEAWLLLEKRITTLACDNRRSG
jgi:hypothetical protein